VPGLLNGASSPSTSILDQFGKPYPTPNDPAWQPPVDPLADPDAARRQLGTVRREIPLTAVITGWDVPMARSAKRELVLGLFEQVAQMIDAIILSDARVQAGLASRLSILGRPVTFEVPRRYRDSRLARECRDAYVEAREEAATDGALGELHRWGVMMGVGYAQILWDTSGAYAIPHALPWHPRYSYWHWLLRCYVAITLDAQEPIIGGNGAWILHAPSAPCDGYRAWMRGAVGAISPWWLGRNYGLRDWMRWSEKHGLPILKLKAPSVGDANQQAIVRFSLATLGSEAVLQMPQNPSPMLSYDVELLEAKDTAHEGFRSLIESCGMEETLALNGQTLTTSMPMEGGSSYAAARVHAGVLQGIVEADAIGIDRTEHRGLARPFAAVNFGLADLAPIPRRDVAPFEDAKTKAQSAQALAMMLVQLRTAGFTPSARDARKMFRRTIPGFDPGRLSAVLPVQIEAQAARAGDKIEGQEGVSATPPPAEDKSQALARLSRLMAKMDPALARIIGKRAAAGRGSFVEGSGELREAMAEIEAARRRT
jgi:phage gp29-like protein